MTGELNDRDLRAAEYVLGTLSSAERAAMELERTVDPATEAALRAWELRLGPLADTVPEIDPSPKIWPGIQRALRGRAGGVGLANDNRIADLARAVQRWRWTAVAAGVLAASLALFIAAGARPGAPAETRYVAVVSRNGEMPALLVSVDVAAGTAQVRPIGAETPKERSLELWYVGAGQPPKSLGVIGAEAKRLPLPEDAERGKLADGVFAVSVEPPGGSLTGTPTGPVVYTGKLIKD